MLGDLELQLGASSVTVAAVVAATAAVCIAAASSGASRTAESPS